jgi:sugar lactone lactonase YvrE
MSTRRYASAVIALAAAILVTRVPVNTQTPVPNSQANPYQAGQSWGQLPAGRPYGNTSAVHVDARGVVWIADKCASTTCTGRTDDPILAFDPSGKLLRTFGSGLFVFPHGIHVDGDGNVWVTDGQGAGGKGHQVFKFSPEGKVLLTLGTAGVAGTTPTTFNQPSDVAVAANGDIFVADGHGGESNARIVKFSKDGRFIKTWGRKGAGRGEFDVPHALAIDSQGRLFVGDRGNSRIQIFDQDGTFLAEWRQFGRPSGIFIDRADTIYVTDSESNPNRNPEYQRGLRVGSARDGSVSAFVPIVSANPAATAGGPEGIAADANGTIYGAETGGRDIKRYLKK